MSRTIVVSDDLYALIESIAKPFVDKEPADVINRLVAKEAKGSIKTPPSRSGGTMDASAINARNPRERGATIDLDGTVIRADSVADILKQVMEYLYAKGYWDKVLELAPYKTSSKRYLFSKSPVHPNSKDFFVPIKYRGLYIEAHKNYKTTLDQLSRFLSKYGITLTYRGT